MFSQRESKDVFGLKNTRMRIVLKCQWKVSLFLAELSLSLATKLHFSLELSDLAWCCFIQLKA